MLSDRNSGRYPVFPWNKKPQEKTKWPRCCLYIHDHSRWRKLGFFKLNLKGFPQIPFWKPRWKQKITGYNIDTITHKTLKFFKWYQKNNILFLATVPTTMVHGAYKITIATLLSSIFYSCGYIPIATNVHGTFPEIVNKISIRHMGPSEINTDFFCSDLNQIYIYIYTYIYIYYFRTMPKETSTVFIRRVTPN